LAWGIRPKKEQPDNVTKKEDAAKKRGKEEKMP
jgi:hypothetical protein